MTRRTGSAAVARRAAPESAEEQLWTAIRAEFVSGPRASLRLLADAHGVSYASLTRRARRERWLDVRAGTRRAQALAELAVARERAARGARALAAACEARAVSTARLERMAADARRAIGALWTAAAEVNHMPNP
jgi:hypothetical protein